VAPDAAGLMAGGGPLRVGIAGYGLAGEVFHAPLVAAVDGLSVAAVVTRNDERGQRARAAYPGVRVAAHVDELWGQIDLLVVAAPNSAHVPLALAAIERGVAVVVDKPLAVSAPEGERVVAAAEATGVPLTVFQSRRLDGDFLTLRRLLAEGRLGEVGRFESRFERFRPEVAADRWREAGDAAAGGGLLLDLGAHLVDQARELFGPPLRVYAEMAARRPGARVDDDTFVALEHPGGVHSHLWMSSVAPLHGQRFAVSGARAGFAVTGLDPQEAQLRDGLRPGDEGFGVAPPGLLVSEAGSEEVALEPGAYTRFYEAVVPWLRDGAPPPVDPRDAVEVLRLLDAARRSATEHRVIELK
jgi:scyllo-inositol 2-dehydrogenase (NADP+)